MARYEQGLNIDEPLAMLRSATTSYYQADGLGSVTSLTNTAGTAAQTYTYDSFGNILATTGSLTNSFRYTGREFDSETSLYYHRARYYDPNAGRFLSEDRIRFQGGANFCRYAQNSPLVWIDPSGDNQCFPVTPNGMTEIPCVDPKGGMSCIYVPGGVYCVVPIPPGSPPGPALSSAGDSTSAPGCRCDPFTLYNEGQKILSEQQGKDLGTGVGATGTNAALTAVEKIIGTLGAGEAAELIPLLDLLLLGNDAREISNHAAEAGEKLRKLYEPCVH